MYYDKQAQQLPMIIPVGRTFQRAVDPNAILSLRDLPGPLASVQMASPTSVAPLQRVAINDDPALENEADVMGAKAAAVGAQLIAQRKETFTNSSSRSASEGTRLPILRQLHQHQEKPSSSETLAKEGLPAQLKAGIENLSGRPMDDVKVHYNSDKPAQLQAHAYAQGTDIHLAPGQEKHLPHEAWHVVQQKRRLKSTIQPMFRSSWLILRMKYGSKGPYLVRPKDFSPKTKEIIDHKKAKGAQRRHIIDDSTIRSGMNVLVEYSNSTKELQRFRAYNYLKSIGFEPSSHDKKDLLKAIEKTYSRYYNLLCNIWPGPGGQNTLFGNLGQQAELILKSSELYATSIQGIFKNQSDAQAGSSVRSIVSTMIRPKKAGYLKMKWIFGLELFLKRNLKTRKGLTIP